MMTSRSEHVTWLLALLDVSEYAMPVLLLDEGRRVEVGDCWVQSAKVRA